MFHFLVVDFFIYSFIFIYLFVFPGLVTVSILHTEKLHCYRDITS